MIPSYTFFGKKPGKHVLIFGAIHGNEICGPNAIFQVIHQIQENKIILETGMITFVPICHQKAYESGVRYMEKNLNRVFCKHMKPSYLEEHIANELTGLIDNADILLDIHSIASEGKPFVFQDYNDIETSEWALSIGLDHIIGGWPEMYEFTDNYDTIGYTHSIGKIGLLVECGNHNEFNALGIATQSIIHTLSYFGLINVPLYRVQLEVKTVIQAKQIFYKQKPGKMIQQWKHLDVIQKEELIAIYNDGECVYMPFSGYMLLPNESTKIGDEWFYVGRSD